jgi:hypothetical protein
MRRARVDVPAERTGGRRGRRDLDLERQAPGGGADVVGVVGVDAEEVDRCRDGVQVAGADVKRRQELQQLVGVAAAQRIEKPAVDEPVSAPGGIGVGPRRRGGARHSEIQRDPDRRAGQACAQRVDGESV